MRPRAWGSKEIFCGTLRTFVGLTQFTCGAAGLEQSIGTSSRRRRARHLKFVALFRVPQFRASKRLHEAYSVLNDPRRRAVYDREAQEVPIRRTDVARRAGIVIRRRHSAEPFAPVRSVGGFEEISLLQSFETFHPSCREMFDRL
jgi:hypothetical protein